MDNSKQHINDNDDAWIAKYRAALDSAPIRHSMREQLRRLLEDARTLLALKGAKMLERYSSSVLKAHPVPPMQATALAHSPEAKALVMGNSTRVRMQKD